MHTFLMIPDDIWLHLKVFLTTSEIGNLRRVIRLPWHTCEVYSFANESLVKKNLFSIRQPARIKAKCAQCGCIAMTEVLWKCGMFREFLPWCRTHVDRAILEDIDVYCLGVEHFL